MPYRSIYLTDELYALVESEAAAKKTTVGRLIVRAVLTSLTGGDAPESPTRRVVQVLRAGGDKGLPLAEVARLAGVKEAHAKKVLAALADLRVEGVPDGLVKLEDRDGTAVWSLTALAA